MKGYSVAVVGTGAVGQAMLEVLAERKFPVRELKLLATARSAGKTVNFAGNQYVIEETTPESFAGVQVALFAGGDASKEFARHAVEAGAVVIDNGSTFRMNPEVPLVVPEVNPEKVKEHKGIIANPNCSTIQMVVVLKPLHDIAVIKRVVVSTYQAVSGAGADAMEELRVQSAGLLDGKEPLPGIFPHQIAFNVLPHIDVFTEDGDTKEELKMINETKKILDDRRLQVTATTVRVPVFNGHSEAVNIETQLPLSPEKAREILASTPGVVVEDQPAQSLYPLPVRATGSDMVYVGRIRRDNTIPYGLNLWVVADNLRKGAATNAVQIAELLVKYNLI